jgi:hypothetical protein
VQQRSGQLDGWDDPRDPPSENIRWRPRKSKFGEVSYPSPVHKKRPWPWPLWLLLAALCIHQWCTGDAMVVEADSRGEVLPAMGGSRGHVGLRRLDPAGCAGEVALFDNGTVVVGAYDAAGDLLPGGGTYGNALNCSWRLSAATNRRVRVRFVAFDVEFHSSCNNDVLEVLEAQDVFGAGVLVSLARWCGDATPTAVVARGPELVMRFTTNRVGAGRGFVAHFDSVDACGTADLAALGDELTFVGVGATVAAVCAWRVAVPAAMLPAGHGLALRFDQVDVACPASVDVRAGNDSAAPLLWSLCRDKSVPVTTPAVSAGTPLHVSLSGVEAARSTLSATVVAVPLLRGQPSSRSPLWSAHVECEPVRPDDNAAPGTFATTLHSVYSGIVGVLAVSLADVRIWRPRAERELLFC